MKGIGLQLVHTADGRGYDLDVKVKRDEQGLISQFFAFGDTENQNQALILIANEGEFKEYPKFGAGISNILNDDNFDYWYSKIMSMLELDGMKVESLQINEKGLNLKAKYL